MAGSAPASWAWSPAWNQRKNLSGCAANATSSPHTAAHTQAPRAFGYQPGREQTNPDEAALISAAATAVLAGRSLRSVADEWNTAGVKTSKAADGP